MAILGQNPNTRPISFLLHNTADTGKPKQLSMNIRPEELTRAETSRTTVHQTLGGAFVDCFGAGLPTIQLAGHTGWRGRSPQTSGLALFKLLHELVYKGWHEERAKMLGLNKDPDSVKLIFSDLLNDINWVCAPMSFTLKRNVSNPLLSYYQINLAYISDNVRDKGKGLKTGIAALDAALKSMDEALDEIDGFIKEMETKAGEFFGPIMDGIGKVMIVANKVNQLAARVVGMTDRVIDGVTGNLIQLASGLSYAMGNILSVAVMADGLPGRTKQRLMGVRSSWLNLYCIYQNIIKPQRLLPDYNDIYGASLCSSTSGGRPLLQFIGANTLEHVMPLGDAGKLTIGAGGINAMNQINAFDVVSDPPSLARVNALSEAIIQGTQGV